MDENSEKSQPSNLKTAGGWLLSLVIVVLVIVFYFCVSQGKGTTQGLMTLFVAVGVLGLAISDADRIYGTKEMPSSLREFLRLFGHAFAIVGAFGAFVAPFLPQCWTS